MTLRRRVLAYVALAAIASCVLTVGVAAVLVRQRVATQRTTALERQANLVAAIGGAPGAMGPGDHIYSVGAGTGIGTLSPPRRLAPARAAAVLAAIPAAGNAQGTISVLGRDLLYVARVTSAGRVVLLRGAGLAFAEWRPFLASLVLAGLGGALLAAGLSFLLARRITRPIGELAAATARIASGERDVVVPVRGQDELAALGAAFNAMSEDLARAREAQQRFFESVSHELKTPLTSIRGYADAVQEGAVAPSDGGRVIAGEADRLERLVRDLLDLARFGRSEFSVSREPVNLAAVANETVERHLPRARELGINLSSRAVPHAGALGDQQRLVQATSNLVENALRLTAADGAVTVTAGEGSITVRDTGPGLAPEDVPRAFERFYLHNRYRSERTDGSGLGLAIVQELVRAMGGSVEASSSPGAGAQFTLRLLPTTEPAHGKNSRKREHETES